MPRVENGRASYRNRWVRTPRFELERKAGEALSGGFAPVAARPPEFMEAGSPPRFLKQMPPIWMRALDPPSRKEFSAFVIARNAGLALYNGERGNVWTKVDP